MAPVLELLVEHVVKTSKSPLLETTGESSSEEGLHALLLFYVFGCRPHAAIPIKICQLKPSLDDAKGVGQEGAHNT